VAFGHHDNLEIYLIMKWYRHHPMQLAVAVALGLIAGAWLGNFRLHCGLYHFVNESYACGQTRVISKGEYTALRNDLLQVIMQAQARGVASTSVYFRDLEDGPNFSINGDARFAPGSLLKLPIVIGALALAEDNSGLLKATAPYAVSSIGDVPIPSGIETPATALVPGKSYSMEEYARRTISDSDNLSYYILLHYLMGAPGGIGRLEQVFEELGVVDPRTPEERVVTVHSYASLLRIIYDASYLNTPDSEKLLSWMSESTFDDGLVAGVPNDIHIADKWGVRNLSDGSEEFHDCGIVYYPDNPYVLCIMTSGNDEAKLTSLISTISQLVYEEIKSRAL
jgi:beta-lactamase class A